MKRELVFLLLGPASVVFTVWVTAGTPGDCIAGYVAALLFLFTFLLSAIAGLADGYLARALPVPVRAPLTAIAGSALVVGLVLALFSTIVQLRELLPFAIGGALYAGLCSLLSHDYGIWQLPAKRRHGLPADAG